MNGKTTIHFSPQSNSSKPPFDRPMPFVRLYSPEDQKRINDINENATRLVG